MSLRKDLYKIEIDSNVYLLVFHKMLPIGFGSALSLYINNWEFLKFDCFGKEKGHFHIYSGSKNKTIYFVETTCEEQIEKSIYEISTNLKTYLTNVNNSKIKNVSINYEKIKYCLQEAKNKMLEYENNFYAKLRD